MQRRSFRRALHHTDPSILSQVCRSWRQVAINIPQLWDTMRVDYKPTTTFLPPEPSDHPVPLSLVVDIWANRSKPLPIHFAIHSNHQFSGSRPIHPSLVASLRNISPRIRTLDIQAGLKSVLEPIFSLPEDEFPALESRRISATEFGVWNNPIIAFGVSPKLRNVFLNIRPAHPLRITLPWPQITHLDMLSAKHPMDLFTWGFLIRFLIHLIEGRVRLAVEARVQDPFRDSLPHVEQQTELTLPLLKVLIIEFVHRHGITTLQPFLSPNLRVPAFGHFHFSSSPSPFNWNPVLNETLVPRTLGQLKSLTLLKVCMSAYKLIDVLKMAMSLEELKFNSMDSEWDLQDNIYFIDSLSVSGPNVNTGETTQPNSTFSLAPRLRKIGLWVDDVSSELLQSYASFILARRLEDPKGPSYHGTDHFRVLLMLDKRRPNVIHAIAPLLVTFGSWGQGLVDVELVDVS